jgi:hypothetical protein
VFHEFREQLLGMLLVLMHDLRRLFQSRLDFRRRVTLEDVDVRDRRVMVDHLAGDEAGVELGAAFLSQCSLLHLRRLIAGLAEEVSKAVALGDAHASLLAEPPAPKSRLSVLTLGEPLRLLAGLDLTRLELSRLSLALLSLSLLNRLILGTGLLLVLAELSVLVQVLILTEAALASEPITLHLLIGAGRPVHPL